MTTFDPGRGCLAFFSCFAPGFNWVGCYLLPRSAFEFCGFLPITLVKNLVFPPPFPVQEKNNIDRSIFASSLLSAACACQHTSSLLFQLCHMAASSCLRRSGHQSPNRVLTQSPPDYLYPPSHVAVDRLRFSDMQRKKGRRVVRMRSSRKMLKTRRSPRPKLFTPGKS